MNGWLFLAALFGGWAVIGGVVVLFVLWPAFMTGFAVVAVIVGAMGVYIVRHSDEIPRR